MYEKILYLEKAILQGEKGCQKLKVWKETDYEGAPGNFRE